MSFAPAESEPRSLLLARVLVGIDGLLWLGLAGLALTDHLLRHQFDCYAGCGFVGSASPVTGWRGAINDPAVIACGLVAVLQFLLAWRLASARRALTFVAGGFQLAIAVGLTATTFSRLSVTLAIDLSVAVAVPALAAAGLLMSAPMRRMWGPNRSSP